MCEITVRWVRRNCSSTPRLRSTSITSLWYYALGCSVTKHKQHIGWITISAAHLHKGNEGAAGVAVQDERPFARGDGALNVNLGGEGGEGGEL